MPKQKVVNFSLDPRKPLTNSSADFRWTFVDIPDMMQGVFTAFKVSSKAIFT